MRLIGRAAEAVAFQQSFWLMAAVFALTVLAVNILGDGLRDTLDPKMAKRG